MGDEEGFLTLPGSGEACGVEQMGGWVERSASDGDSLDCLIFQISKDSL